MKKAVVFITCLVFLGPAMSMAHHVETTKIVVKEKKHGKKSKKRVVTKVIEVKQPHRHWRHHDYREDRARDRYRYDGRRDYRHAYRKGYRDGYRQDRHYSRYDRRQDRVEYGRVISVEPVYRVSTQHRQGNSCVRYSDEPRRRSSATPMVVGAIIGGALGHSLGDSHGDPEAAALAGGLLGASIGRDIGEHARHGRQLVVAGPCVPRTHRSTRRELVEYVVSYRYNGAVYKTRMDYDPGEWVALDVDVKPA